MSRLKQSDADRRALADYSSDFSEALARGITIITAFNADRRQMSLSDVSRVVDLPRATVRRAMYTLAHLGYVEAEGRLFRLTPKVLTLATAYLTSNPVSMVLQPLCERISSSVNATCSVAVLDGGEVVMVARAAPVQPATVGLGVGYRLPAYCSALGRALLSSLPDDRLDAYFDALTPVQLTPSTVTDKGRLRDLVLTARDDGYALVEQEAELGFRSLAMPLHRYDGAPVAAINIGTQMERMTAQDMLRDLLPLLRAEADSVRNQLI